LEFLSLPAVILAVFTSTVLLASRNWRWSIAALAGQYLIVFLLLAPARPFSLALTKLVQGWMAGAVLGLALAGAGMPVETGRPAVLSSLVFRLLAAALVTLVVFSTAPVLAEWIPGLGPAQAAGALILIGLGLLHLGLSLQSFRVIMGLLTVLSGFEILYTSVEASVLVTGLLAGVTLGLALLGAYLLAAPTIPESE
jgi:hypothetical protein